MMKRSAGALRSSLQDPRPQPLSLPTAASRPSKRPRVNGGEDDDDAGMRPAAGPVIVYEHTPKVVHARPDEFKALVQRLTGRVQQPVQPTTAPPLPQEEEEATTATDPLVLTLGQAPPPPLDDYYTPPALGLPSPGGGGGLGLAAAGFLLSPGSFLFSPATMLALQELIS